MRAGWVCALWPLASLAAAGAPDPVFQKIASQMARNQALLPNYICVQSVERWSRGLTCGLCEAVERMRLEVSMIGGEELYAWPGGGAFDERGIYEMIGREGMILTGEYATIAGGVFLTDDAILTPLPDTTLNGRRAVHYAYQLRGQRAGLMMAIDERQIFLKYRGEFWADAGTLHLLRLTMEVFEIPEGVNLKSARASIEYQRARIGSSEFTLPAAAESELVRGDGLRSRNRTAFTGCRQYVASSTISFGESEAAEAAAAPKQETVPEDMTVMTSLAAPIDLAGAMVGDEVKLIAFGKSERAGFSIPGGAVIRARIVGLTVNSSPDREAVLCLRTTALERDGRQMPFRSRLSRIRTYELFKGTQTGMRLHRPPDQDSVVVFDAGEIPVVPKGVHFIWRTME